MSRDDEYGADSSGGIGSLFAQLPSVLWQRRWFVIVPMVVGLIGATAAAFLLPAKYVSTAVLLVQAPSLPQDVIGSQNDDYIDRRIERIRQQIINRPALVSIIEANQLYASERKSKPLSTLIDTMREAVVLTTDASGLKSTKPEDNTISFRLAFWYSDATKAQAVTQQLMEKVLELNSTTNSVQMAQTVQFLSDQGADLQRQIAEVEGQLSALNARYGGVLANGGFAMIGGSGGSLDMQISTLERENAGLSNQRETLGSAETRDPAVVAAEGQLAAARSIYSDSHPDVIAARQRLVEAKQFATQNVQRIPVDAIQRQIAFNNSQIAALRAAKAREMAQVSTALNEKAQAPVVQQQAAQLQQRLEGLNSQFQAVAAKLLSAKAGARADEEQMGERLIVVDPPVVPDKPTSPDRPLFIGVGLGGGLALGFLLAFAVELFLRPIRDPGALIAITGMRPLTMVPVVSEHRSSGRNKGGKNSRRRRRWGIGKWRFGPWTSPKAELATGSE